VVDLLISVEANEDEASEAQLNLEFNYRDPSKF